MGIYLNNYKMGYVVFVLSKSDEITNILLSQNKKVGQLLSNKLVILPDDICIELSKEEVLEWEKLNTYDVIEISNNGIGFIWYSDDTRDCFIPLTQHCNSNCIMCPSSVNERKRNNDFTVEQLKTIISLLPSDLNHLTITGGEPTLIGYTEFISIFEYISNTLPNAKLLLLTNGRTFGDKAFWEQISTLNTSMLRVAIPIHGSNSELHDYITQAKGSFIQTLRGLTNVISSGIESEIRIVVSKANCEDILNISKLIVEYFPNVNVVHFIGLEMRGNCVLNHEKIIISYEEAFNHSKAAIDYLLLHGIDVELYNFPHCMISSNYWSLAVQSISEYKKEYELDCSECALSNICCGLFSATKKYYKPTVHPIKETSK